jgi:hypothetical protein
MIQQIHQCQTQRGSGAQKQPPPTSQVSNSKKILIVISNQLCRSERILEEEGTSVAPPQRLRSVAASHAAPPISGSRKRLENRNEADIASGDTGDSETDEDGGNNEEDGFNNEEECSDKEESGNNHSNDENDNNGSQGEKESTR